MCAACIEYTKDTLTLNEFQSALKETTRDDRPHYDAVGQIIRDYSNEPEKLKKNLQEQGFTRKK